MGRFYGAIGFAEQVETRPGIWEEQITERNYKGDLIRVSRQTQASNQLNDNINVSNEISIIAEPYVNENFYSIRYVAFRGAKWKVSNVRVEFPRLILTLGGLYNG